MQADFFGQLHSRKPLFLRKNESQARESSSAGAQEEDEAITCRGVLHNVCECARCNKQNAKSMHGSTVAVHIFSYLLVAISRISQFSLHGCSSNARLDKQKVSMLQIRHAAVFLA